MLPFINPPPLFKLHNTPGEGLPNYLPVQCDDDGWWGPLPPSAQDGQPAVSQSFWVRRHIPWRSRDNEWPQRIEMSEIKIISKVPRVILSIHLTSPSPIPPPPSHAEGLLTPYGTTAPSAIRRNPLSQSVVLVEIRSGQTTATRSELNYEATSRAPTKPSEE